MQTNKPEKLEVVIICDLLPVPTMEPYQGNTPGFLDQLYDELEFNLEADPDAVLFDKDEMEDV